jgi:hypothetical protein
VGISYYLQERSNVIREREGVKYSSHMPGIYVANVDICFLPGKFNHVENL